jgi:hypothetical protein
MNDPKDHLRQMIDRTVSGDTEGMEKAFKQFILPRSADFMNGDPKPKADAAAESEPAPEPKAEPAPEPKAEE